MKTSNKILLPFGVIPVIVILVMIFSFRNELEKETPIQDIGRSSYSVKNIDFADFDEIKAEGIWVIELTGGDQFKVELRLPDDNADKASVTKFGNKLILKSEKESFSMYSTPVISITMPVISRLNFDGRCDVKISDFKISELDININGVAGIVGTVSSVEQLSINGNGVLNADFMHMPATNALFNFNGVHMIILKMNGGELAGRLNGPGKLKIKGRISKKTIQSDNPDNITFRYMP